MSAARTAPGMIALDPAAAAPRPSGISADALAAAFEAEARLLGDLTGILRSQRAGVAADDVQQVDDSVFATHRVLHTVGEARRRRRTLIGLLVGAEDVGIQELEGAMGGGMTERLRAARDGLQAAARTLSREIAMNRQVLQAALQSGDEYLRALRGEPQRHDRYDSEAKPRDDGQRSGTLFNRQV